VFENRVLREMFGPKRDDVTGEWRNLHSGELHNLNSSPDTIRQIKSRRTRWAGHMSRMGGGRTLYRVLLESQMEKDQGLDGRIGSKWTLGRLAGGYGVDSPGSR
jgi:hypothetical protein